MKKHDCAETVAFIKDDMNNIYFGFIDSSTRGYIARIDDVGDMKEGLNYY